MYFETFVGLGCGVPLCSVNFPEAFLTSSVLLLRINYMSLYKPLEPSIQPVRASEETLQTP
jgi:hypothetical protein